MATFKLPRLKANLAIVNGKGQPLDYFLRFWNIEVAPRIEQQEGSQDEILSQLEQQQAEIEEVQDKQEEQLALINQALELAGIAIGQNANTLTSNVTKDITTSWSLGTPVTFVGAVAGTVTIPSSGLYTTPFSTMSVSDITGQVRLVEIEAGVDTVIGGPWGFTAKGYPAAEGEPQFIIINNPGDINTFTSARTNTGDIGYRIDAMTDASSITDVSIRTSVRRS